ncbi:hypothetical protein BgiMline_014031 [Biomphalaria glabrata]|nr:hypothetical protein BgiMline_012823 [Biomphalaria glabrata]
MDLKLPTLYKMDQQHEQHQEDFPSIFTTDSPQDIVSTDDLIALHSKLCQEIKYNEETSRNQSEDNLRVLNLLTYIYFQICPQSYAAANCNYWAFRLSKGTICYVTSVIYRLQLMTMQGKIDKVEECQEILTTMRTSESYRRKLSEAKAELAYTLSRLRGLNNIRRAIHLYQEVVEFDMSNFVWRFGLGLACSRIVCWFTSSPLISVCERNKFMLTAVNHLMDAAENSPETELSSQSYAQLAVLKRFLNNTGLETENCKLLFKGHDVQSLVEKALEGDPKNPKTLRDCGRLMKQFDVDEAIKILESSVSKMQHSQAYHNLGICYVMRATQKVAPALNKISPDQISPKQEEVMRSDQLSQNTEDQILLNQENVISPDGLPQEMIPNNQMLHHSVNETEAVHFIRSSKRKKKKKKKLSFFSYCPVYVQQLNYQNEDVGKAKYNYKQAIRSSPDNYSAMYALGLLYRSCGHIAEAKQWFTKIVKKLNLQDLKTASDVLRFTTAIYAQVQLGLCALDDSRSEDGGYQKCKSEIIKILEVLHHLKPSPPGTEELLTFLKDHTLSDEEKSSYLILFRKCVAKILKIIQRYELNIRKSSMLKTEN